MGEVFAFPCRPRPEPEHPPDEIVAYYLDKLKRGVPKDEAAELAALFWRTMGVCHGD